MVQGITFAQHNGNSLFKRHVARFISPLTIYKKNRFITTGRNIATYFNIHTKKSITFEYFPSKAVSINKNLTTSTQQIDFYNSNYNYFNQKGILYYSME